MGTVAVTGVAVLSFGCSTVPRDFSITDEETRNAIALCNGGYGASYAAALRTMWIERNGELVAGGELGQVEQGQNPFVISDLSGANAVVMYNTYVECVSQSRQALPTEQTTNHQSGQTGTGTGTEQVGSEDMELRCFDGQYRVDGPQGYTSQINYSCLIRNNTRDIKYCKLLSACVVKDRRTGRFLVRHESEILSFSILSGRVEEQSGEVRCGIPDRSASYADIERTLMCSN